MNASGFEAFCGGAFLNESLLLDNTWFQFSDCFVHTALIWNESLLLDNTWPQFSDCFVHTALVWVPCGFLFLMMPFYVRCVQQQQNRGTSFPITLLNGAKLFCCITLSILALVQLLMRTEDNGVSHSEAAYLGDAFQIAAFILMAVMTQYERLRGAQSTAVPFFFWLLSVMSATVPLYTSFMLEIYSRNVVSFTVGILMYILLLLSLVLTIFFDHGGDSDYTPLDKKPCPMTTCSYPYYLLFIWMFKLMVTGFKRDLVESDMWQLPREEQSEELARNFERLWANEEDRCRRVNFNRQRRQVTLTSVRYTTNGTVGDVTSTTTTTTANGSSTNGTAQLTTTFSDKPMTERSSLIRQSPGEDGSQKESKKVTPSLLRVVTKMFWKELFKYSMMKIVSDIILLMNPVLLGVLMKVLSTREPGRDWQGYVLCLGMFVAIIGKSMLFAHSMFGSSRMGMQMKSVLIAAIYQKSLKMTSAAKNKSTVGEVVNLMSVDAQRLLDMMNIFFFGLTTPVTVIVAITMLYFTIGGSIFAGLGVLVVLMPVNLYVFHRLRILSNINLRFKDIRIKLYNEILNGIKVLKFYAWEPSFRQKIQEIRVKEVATLLKLAFLNMMMSISWDMAPFLVTLATFATYVLSSPFNYLTSSKAFVALALFNILRSPLNVLSTIIAYFVQAVVSLRRINNFLLNEDLDPDAVTKDSIDGNVISIKDATFTWNREMPTTLPYINLQVAPGKLVAVVGPVGCGKSSLISAMLGEMEKLNGTVNLKGSVAYVPQQAWIQNATVRDNILMGRPFVRSRYNSILTKCELDRDLTILGAGDMTEIGEKGINLSGGQKQRVSVARAVYSGSDVYLLDDPLSAVDSHVGKAIFKNVIGPTGILKKKTRVLVTHGIHWLPMVDEVVVMIDGKISERGSYEQLMSHDGPFAQFLKHHLVTVQDEVDDDPEIAEIRDNIIKRLDSVTSDNWSSADELGRDGEKKRRKTKKKPKKEKKESPVALEESSASIIPLKEAEITVGTSGNLTTIETVESGRVSRKVFTDYGKAAGMIAIISAFLFYCLFQAFSVSANFWLNRWTEDAALLNASSRLHVTSTVDINDTYYDDVYGDDMSAADELTAGNHFYLTVYGALGLCQVVGLMGFNYYFWTRMVEAGRVMHARLADRLMRSPMAFFDTTPVGRILNRVSRDVETVDNTLPLIIRDWLVTFAMVLMTLVVITIQTPLSLVVILPTIVIYYFCQGFYVPTARQLKRIESVTRSPIYILFSETMNGASSIRAYGVTQRFLQDNKARVDRNIVYYFAAMGAVRWLQLNLDVLAGIIVMASGLFAMLNTDSKSADAGLSVSYALQISGTLTWMTRQISEFETNIVSVERLKEYSELETEAEWVIPEQRPPPSWPETGEVTFDNYMTRYRPGLDLVLRGVTCTIKNGEKVGIVGRTGAGKSSLTLSLFRLIEAAEGSILIDGLNIADMGLHDLRSSLTILPQDPVLFSGSLRMNLDPFGEYDDQQLWKALERAHLTQAVDSLTGQLDFECGEEGSNLSVGQRQLVCLARTLLRRTKILVLDEATAAVDMETDALIQDTIRSAFSSCTIITIAHRLNTIMDYDRIMVMDAGLVTEFASPEELLSNKQSVFYAMAKDSNLV